MLPDEVHLRRLLRLGRAGEEIVEEVHHILEAVPENSRHVRDDIDPRPAQLAERDQLEARHPPRAVPLRPGPNQVQDDGHGVALGLDGIKTPESHGAGLRVLSLVLLLVLRDDLLGRGGPPQESGLGRHPVRIEGVDVPSRGQDPWSVPKQVSARHRRNVLPPEGPNNTLHFLGVLQQQTPDLQRSLDVLAAQPLAPCRAAESLDDLVRGRAPAPVLANECEHRVR
mmetsp:Transcript_688/g.2036  ORF Transcript_688/g.2036 Transcript_688/m.2036 type:complete len:226 (-) Transcript_688:1352-2029(-)